MVRRTKEQAQETREQLLDAAERVFHAKGVARATLDEIAREAGLTRGALYWHFSNKAELFAAMCDRVTLPMQTVLQGMAATPGPDPLGGLRRQAVSILHQLACDQHTQRVFEIILLKTDGSSEIAEVMAREQQNGQACRRQLHDLLQAACSCGQLPAGLDCEAGAFALSTFMTGAMHEWLEWRDFDLAQRADWLVNIWFAGLQYGGQTQPSPLTQPD